VPIEALSLASLDYLAAFDLKCICVSNTGRVYTTKNPAGASLAYWCRASDTDKVAKAAWFSGDVPEAARRLQIAVTPHSVVAKRTADRTAALDNAIAEAIDAGVLRRFNSEYRSRRLAAKRNGQRFISYGQALGKLRSVIAGAVASGGKIPTRSFVAVFEDPPAGFVDKAKSPRDGPWCVRRGSA
jgi:hypothetical protein